jgi:hypothetical protein
MALEVIFTMGGRFMPTRTVSLGAFEEQAAPKDRYHARRSLMNVREIRFLLAQRSRFPEYLGGRPAAGTLYFVQS